MSVDVRFSEQAWVTLLVAAGCPDAEWIQKTFEDWQFPLEVVELDSLPDEHPWSRFRLNCHPAVSALVAIDGLWENVAWTAGENLIDRERTLEGKRAALEWLITKKWEYVSFLLDHVASGTSGLSCTLVLSRRVWKGQAPKIFVKEKGTDWFDTSEGFMMSVEPEPRLLFGAGSDETLVAGVREWIRRNRETVLGLWEWELDSSDVGERLRLTKPPSIP